MAVFLSKWHSWCLVSVVYVTMHHTPTHTHTHMIAPPLRHHASCSPTVSVKQKQLPAVVSGSRLCVTPSLHRAVNSQVAAALPRLNSQVPSRAVCHRNGSIWKQTKGSHLTRPAPCRLSAHGPVWHWKMAFSLSRQSRTVERVDGKCQHSNFPGRNKVFSRDCHVQFEMCVKHGRKDEARLLERLWICR